LIGTAICLVTITVITIGLGVPVGVLVLPVSSIAVIDSTIPGTGDGVNVLVDVGILVSVGTPVGVGVSIGNAVISGAAVGRAAAFLSDCILEQEKKQATIVPSIHTMKKILIHGTPRLDFFSSSSIGCSSGFSLGGNKMTFGLLSSLFNMITRME
jgi:hypothetical protein